VQVLGRNTEEETEADESDGTESSGRRMSLEEEPGEEYGERENESSSDLVEGRIDVF